MSKEKKSDEGSTRTVTCGTVSLTLTKRDGQVSQVLADISRELSTYLISVKSGDQRLNTLATNLSTGSREVLSTNDKAILDTALQRCLELEKNGKPNEKKDATTVLNTICCRMFGKGFSDTGQFLASALAALVYAGDPTTIYTACTSDTAAAIGLLLPPFSFFCRKNGKSWDKYFLLIDFQIARYLSLHSASLKIQGENKFSETIKIFPSPLGMSNIFTKYNDMTPTNGLNMLLMDIRDLKRKLQTIVVRNNLIPSHDILEMNEIPLIAFVRSLDKSLLEPSYDAVINDVSSLEKLYNLCHQIQETIFVGDNVYNSYENYLKENIGAPFDVPIWLLELFISKYKTEIYSKKSDSQLKIQALRAGIIDCLKGHDFGLNAVLLYKRDFFSLFTPAEWDFLETKGSGDDVVLEFADTFIGSASCLVNSKDVLSSGLLKCKFNSLKEKIYMEQVVGRSDISSKSDGSDIISCIPGVNKIVVSQDFTSTKTFGEDAHAMQLQNAIKLVDEYFEETNLSNQSCADFIIKNKNKMIPFMVVLKSKEEDYDSANTGIRLGIPQFDDVNTSINMNFTSQPPPPIRSSVFKVVTNGPATGLPDPVEVYLKMVFNNMHTSVFPEQWRTRLVNFNSYSKDNKIWFSECLHQIILDTKNDAISGLSVVKQKALLKQIIKNANLNIALSKKGKSSALPKKGKSSVTNEPIEPNESPFDIYFKEWNQICPKEVDKLKTIITNISRLSDNEIKKDPNQILLNFIIEFTDLLNAANSVDNQRRNQADACLRDNVSSPQCNSLTSSCAILTEISDTNRRAAFDVSTLSKDDDGPPEEKRGRTTTSVATPTSLETSLCIPDKTFTTAVLGFFTSIVDGMPTKEEAQINHINRESSIVKSNDEKIESIYLIQMEKSGITDNVMKTSFEKCLLILEKIDFGPSLYFEKSNLFLNSANLLESNRIRNIIYDIKKLLPNSQSFLEFAKSLLGIIHDENNFGPINEIYNTLGIFNNSTREVFLIIWLFNIFYPSRANEISSNNIAQLLKGIDKDDVERIGFVNMDAINIELEREFSILSKIVNNSINSSENQETTEKKIEGIIERIIENGGINLIQGLENKVSCPTLRDLPQCLYNYILKERQNTLTSIIPEEQKQDTSLPKIQLQFSDSSASQSPRIGSSYSQRSAFVPQGPPPGFPALPIHSPRSAFMPQGPSPGFQTSSIQRSLFEKPQKSSISQEQEGDQEKKRNQEKTREAEINDIIYDTLLKIQNEDVDENIPRIDRDEIIQTLNYLMDNIDDEKTIKDMMYILMRQHIDNLRINQSTKGRKNEENDLLSMAKTLIKTDSAKKLKKSKGGGPSTRRHKLRVKRFTKGRQQSNETYRKGDTRKTYRKKNNTRRH